MRGMLGDSASGRAPGWTSGSGVGPAAASGAANSFSVAGTELLAGPVRRGQLAGNVAILDGTGLPLFLNAPSLNPLRRKPFEHFGVICPPAGVQGEAGQIPLVVRMYTSRFCSCNQATKRLNLGRVGRHRQHWAAVLPAERWRKPAQVPAIARRSPRSSEDWPPGAAGTQQQTQTSPVRQSGGGGDPASGSGGTLIQVLAPNAHT